jgi:RHS repeat-associated protein
LILLLIHIHVFNSLGNSQNLINNAQINKSDKIQEIGRAVLTSRKTAPTDTDTKILLFKEKIANLREKLITIKNQLLLSENKIESILGLMELFKTIVNDALKDVIDYKLLIKNILNDINNNKDNLSGIISIEAVSNILNKITEFETEIPKLFLESDKGQIIKRLNQLIKRMKIVPVIQNGYNESPGLSTIVKHSRDLNKPARHKEKSYTPLSKQNSNLQKSSTKNIPLFWYLLESYPEIQFTGDNALALRIKAQELQTPVNIYEYVRNNFEYALYHGSRSNSINTFSGKRGNDVDLSTVLIAMLRSQGIPARFAVGNVQLPVKKVMNWLGVKNEELAKNVMINQGIREVRSHNDMLSFEHVWVEMFVSYENYRGAGLDSEVNCYSEPDKCQWIAVDPSFKLKKYHNQGIDILGKVEFPYTDYYNAMKDNNHLKDKNPLEIYEELVLKYLRKNYPGKTLEDVADSGTIISEKNMILPASLPYTIVENNFRTYDTVAEHDLYEYTWTKYLKIHIGFENQELGEYAFTRKVSEFSSEKISINMTESEHINKPFKLHLELDGAGIDDPKSLTATGSISITYDCIGGGHYLIVLGDESSNWSQFHRATEKLLDISKSYTIVYNPDSDFVPYIDNGNGIWDNEDIELIKHDEAMHDLTGGLLYAAQTWFCASLREQISRLSNLNNIVAPINAYLGIISTTYEVEYLDDIPFSIMPGGLLIDMQNIRYNGVWQSNQAGEISNETFVLMGHILSSLEHEVWQEMTGYDAISTVRGIQMALSKDAELIKLTSDLKTDCDKMKKIYKAFNFQDQAPEPLEQKEYNLFGTKPVIWISPSGDSNEYAFNAIETCMFSDFITYTSSSDLKSTVLNTFNNLSKINNLERGDIYTITFPDGTKKTGVVFSEQTKEDLRAYLETVYKEDIDEIPGFPYFDMNNRDTLFDPEKSVYRNVIIAKNEHDTYDLYTMFNTFYLNEVDYIIPSHLTTGEFYNFSVYISIHYDEETGKINSILSDIKNKYNRGAGGHVKAGEEVLNPSTDTSGKFNQTVFTDKNLIGNSNNDLVITPSTIDPVSTVTGNMYHDETDISIKGRGLNIILTRTYNSGPTLTYTTTEHQPFSKGWTHSYNMRLIANDYGKDYNHIENKDGEISSITYVDERGGEYNYLVESDGTIKSPTGLFANLTLDDDHLNEHTIIFSNGVKYIFEGSLKKPEDSAVLKQINDPYGNELNFEYEDGWLKYINDNISDRNELTFLYENERLDKIIDWTGRKWSFGYDTENRLNTMTNPLGEPITYTYHPGTDLLNEIIKPENRNGEKVTTTFKYYRNNKAYSYTDLLGNKEILNYDLFRKRTRVTDPRNNVREYYYDSNGNLIKLEEPDRGIMFFENNPDGLRCQKTNPLGYITQYSYAADQNICTESDTDGNITLEIDPGNHKSEYTYGIYSQIHTFTDKNGNQRTYNYYETEEDGGVIGKLKDKQIMMNDRQVKLEEYKYYPNGNLRKRIEYIDREESRTRTTEYFYYPDTINIKKMVISGSDGLTVMYEYTYDDLNRKESETLYRQRSAIDQTMTAITTNYQYDTLDRVKEVTDPLGNILTTQYDKNGKMFQKTIKYKKLDNTYEEEQILFKKYYDAADRLEKEIDALENTTTYVYDATGNLVLKTDANNHETHYEYDSKGRQTAIVDANGNRTETKYDLAGNVTHIIDARENVTSYTYNNLGQKIAEETPMGHVTEYTYYPNGNLKSITDANALNGKQEKNSNGVSVYYEYDELDRLIYILDANNGETQIMYDLLSENNITRITDAEGRTTEFVYNDLGQLKQIIKPQLEPDDPYLKDISSSDAELLAQSTNRNRPIVFTYDTAGNILTKTDHKNQQAQYFYDELNRLRRINYINDNTFETFDYNHFGDLVFVSNENVTYTYTYDEIHRMTSKQDSRFGKKLVWKYDAVGNIDYKINYQGEVTDYTYDSANRLVNLRNMAYVQVNYHYDAAGRLLDRILSNGAKTSYEYDDDNRLTKISNTSISRTVAVQNYYYDNVGNITSIKDEDDSVIAIFDYDPLYRLISADYEKQENDRTYTYDSVGNRLTETRGNDIILSYQYNARNQLRSVQSKNERRTYFYDDNGNRCAKFSLNGSEKEHSLYDYDTKNRMISAEGISFIYDVNDYRISKIKPGSTTHYLLEGEHLEAMYDQDGKIIAKFLRGVIIDEIVSGYFYDEIGKKTNYTFHHDHQRSVVALTDRHGNIVERTMYGPFGEEYEASGGIENILKYTGREIDRETGLYYYRIREYDKETGSFVSEDPIGFGGGVNFYVYVGNNPINAIDPFGLETILIFKTERDPSRDPVQPWRHVGNFAVIDSIQKYGDKYSKLDIEVIDVNRVSQVNNALSSFEDIVDIKFIGHASSEALFIGNESLPDTNISFIEGTNNVNPNNLNWNNLTNDAVIDIWGCNAGYGDNSIAQHISNASSSNVTAPDRTINFEDSGKPYIDWWKFGSWNDFSPQNASGGFVLYPSKPNLNMMKNVYTK